MGAITQDGMLMPLSLTRPARPPSSFRPPPPLVVPHHNSIMCVKSVVMERGGKGGRAPQLPPLYSREALTGNIRLRGGVGRREEIGKEQGRAGGGGDRGGGDGDHLCAGRFFNAPSRTLISAVYSRWNFAWSFTATCASARGENGSAPPARTTPAAPHAPMC